MNREYLVKCRTNVDNLYEAARHIISQSEIMSLIGGRNQALNLQQKRAAPHWGHMWHE